jgi:hypothetical protein
MKWHDTWTNLWLLSNFICIFQHLWSVYFEGKKVRKRKLRKSMNEFGLIFSVNLFIDFRNFLFFHFPSFQPKMTKLIIIICVKCEGIVLKLFVFLNVKGRKPKYCLKMVNEFSLGRIIWENWTRVQFLIKNNF